MACSTNPRREPRAHIETALPRTRRPRRSATASGAAAAVVALGLAFSGPATASTATPKVQQGPGGLVVTADAESVYISPGEMAQNYDVAPGPTNSATGSLSARLLAELVGVAPATLNSADAMDITNNQNGPGNATSLTRAEVTSGFGSPPQPASFYVSEPAQLASSDTTFIEPGTTASINSSTGGSLSVTLNTSGSVLGVPTPTGTSSPAVGVAAGFSEPGPISIDAFTAGAPADANGLSYSWDFGDGSPPSAPSPSASVSHAYSTVGSYDVRVTVTDAAGNSGVSPQALVVTVGKAAQTIAFPQVGPYTFGQAPVTLTATATSGLPVTFTVSSGPCIVNRATLTFTGAGSCVVAADQAGDATHAAAPTATSTITIAPVPTPPACSDQTVKLANGVTTQIELVCADAPGDPGDALSFAIVTPPAHGTLSGLDSATGTVTFVPSGTYSGSDSFTFDATDAQGGAAVATVTIAVAQQIPPASTSPPAISGPLQVGQALSCSAGAWFGDMPQSDTYQWQRDGSAIPGATAPGYIVAAADQGHTLTCAVTASNAGGSATATSPGVAVAAAQVVSPPTPTTPPTSAGPPGVSGAGRIGQTLTCSSGAWSGTAPLSVNYRWTRDQAAIAGANGPKHVLVAADAGHTIRCVVSATNAAGTASAQSSAVAIPLASSAFTLLKPKVAVGGSISVRLEAPGAGRFAAVASFPATAVSPSGARKSAVVTYATVSASITKAGAKTLTLRPTKRAAGLLKTRGRLRVELTITFTPVGGKARSRLVGVTVSHGHASSP